LAGRPFSALGGKHVVLLGGIGCVIAFGHRGSIYLGRIIACHLHDHDRFYQNFSCAFRSSDSFQKLTGIQFTELA